MTIHIFLLPFCVGEVFCFSLPRMLYATGVLDALYQTEVIFLAC